jgi:hypothetical protein
MYKLSNSCFSQLNGSLMPWLYNYGNNGAQCDFTSKLILELTVDTPKVGTNSSFLINLSYVPLLTLHNITKQCAYVLWALRI